MDELLTAVAAKKERLDALRPVSQAVLRALQKSYDVDLTYTSNAIEGNTLTLRETAELIEHGITVGGKPLRDHLEAVDHYNAVLWMRDLASTDAQPLPATSFDAHFRLVAIHPFGDGNGRAARLLMNLLLLRGGYPPVAVRPEDRNAYLDALEQASLRDDLVPFQTFMHQRLDATLAEYLSALQEALPPGIGTR